MVPRLQQKDLDENNKLSHFFLAGAYACKGESLVLNPFELTFW
jgi:hypothetical protein